MGFEGRQSHWWCRLQALQDPHRPQIHRQGLHCYAPKAKGEPEEVLQGKEVHSLGLATQEDSRHPQGLDPTRTEPEDTQGRIRSQAFPQAQVRRQGIKKPTSQYSFQSVLTPRW